MSVPYDVHRLLGLQSEEDRDRVESARHLCSVVMKVHEQDAHATSEEQLNSSNPIVEVIKWNDSSVTYLADLCLCWRSF